MGNLRVAFVCDTPMPYRISNALSGELLGMFPNSEQMHLFLAGVRAGYDGPILSPYKQPIEVHL